MTTSAAIAPGMSLKETYERRKKLAQFQYLAWLPQQFLWELAEVSQKTTLRRNTIVYNDANISSGHPVYLLIKGEVELERKPIGQPTEVQLLSTYHQKYSNGIKIKSYHGNQQKSIMTLRDNQTFGGLIESDDIYLETAKCRSLCIAYVIPWEPFKSVWQAAKKNQQLSPLPSQIRQIQQPLKEKALSFLKLSELENGKRRQSHPAKLPICRYNKVSNIPLELSSECKSFETKQKRINRSTLEHYQLKRERRKPTFQDDENSFIGVLMRQIARRKRKVGKVIGGNSVGSLAKLVDGDKKIVDLHPGFQGMYRKKIL